MNEKWPDPLKDTVDLHGKIDTPGVYCADCLGFIMETTTVVFHGRIFCFDGPPPKECPHCKSTSHNFNIVCDKVD